MFGFLKKRGSLSINKIVQGKYLELAKETSVTFFFERRMQNPPRKAKVGAWFILHEDTEWIYWGYPTFKGLFSDDRLVRREEFYKCSKTAVITEFPSFKTLYGNVLRLRLINIFQAYFLEQEQKHYYIYSLNFKATLKQDCIEVYCPFYLKEVHKDQENSIIHIAANLHLSKDALEVLHIEILHREEEIL